MVVAVEAVLVEAGTVATRTRPALCSSPPMEFDAVAPSKPAPRRAPKAPIFCVGWRVFVHWPPRDGQPPGPVPLTDPNGQPLANDLADGQQVEIIAWRPRSREGLLYHVRRLADGSESWIGAHCLRREALAAVPDPTAPAPQR